MTTTKWGRYTTDYAMLSSKGVWCDLKIIRFAHVDIEVAAYSRRTGAPLGTSEWTSPGPMNLRTLRLQALRMAEKLMEEAEAKALVEAAELERRGGLA